MEQFYASGEKIHARDRVLYKGDEATILYVIDYDEWPDEDCLEYRLLRGAGGSGFMLLLASGDRLFMRTADCDLSLYSRNEGAVESDDRAEMVESGELVEIPQTEESDMIDRIGSFVSTFISISALGLVCVVGLLGLAGLVSTSGGGGPNAAPGEGGAIIFGLLITGGAAGVFVYLLTTGNYNKKRPVEVIASIVIFVTIVSVFALRHFR